MNILLSWIGDIVNSLARNLANVTNSSGSSVAYSTLIFGAIGVLFYRFILVKRLLPVFKEIPRHFLARKLGARDIDHKIDIALRDAKLQQSSVAINVIFIFIACANFVAFVSSLIIIAVLSTWQYYISALRILRGVPALKKRAEKPEPEKTFRFRFLQKIQGFTAEEAVEQIIEEERSEKAALEQAESIKPVRAKTNAKPEPPIEEEGDIYLVKEKLNKTILVLLGKSGEEIPSKADFVRAMEKNFFQNEEDMVEVSSILSSWKEKIKSPPEYCFKAYAFLFAYALQRDTRSAAKSVKDAWIDLGDKSAESIGRDLIRIADKLHKELFNN